VERDTPCTSILLALHICTAGWGKGYTLPSILLALHVCTAGCGKGYTLHGNTAEGGKW